MRQACKHSDCYCICICLQTRIYKGSSEAADVNPVATALRYITLIGVVETML